MKTPQSLPVSDNYLKSMARKLSQVNPSIFEDLVQEGRITVWRLSAERPCKEPAYYARAARNRMYDVALGKRPMTGQAGHKGHTAPSTVSLEVMATDKPVPPETDAADWAYHRAEIHRAIRELPPSQRHCVIGRFWLDQSWAEMGSTAADAWHRNRGGRAGARVRLMERLAHLESAV